MSLPIYIAIIQNKNSDLQSKVNSLGVYYVDQDKSVMKSNFITGALIISVQIFLPPPVGAL